MSFTANANDRVERIDERAYQCLDQRGTQMPIPENLDFYLNRAQLDTLQNLEDFGWRLYFVRRPLFAASTVVVLSPEGKQCAVVEDDGGLNLEPGIELRGPPLPS